MAITAPRVPPAATRRAGPTGRTPPSSHTRVAGTRPPHAWRTRQPARALASTVSTASPESSMRSRARKNATCPGACPGVCSQVQSLPLLLVELARRGGGRHSLKFSTAAREWAWR